MTERLVSVTIADSTKDGVEVVDISPELARGATALLEAAKKVLLVIGIYPVSYRMLSEAIAQCEDTRTKPS